MKKRFLLCALAAAFLAGCSANTVDRENEIAYRQVGLNEMEAGEYPEAIEAFKKALALSGGKVGELERDICYYMVDVYAAMGDLDTASELAASLIEYDVEDYRAHFLKGNIELMKGSGEHSTYFETAEKLSGGSAQMYSAIYTGLMRAGYKEEADSYLEKALSMKGSDDDEDYVRSMSVVYYTSGDYDTALDYYQKLSGLSAEEMAAVADCIFRQGDYEKALVQYEAAEEAGFEPDSRFLLGKIICCEKTGDFVDADELMSEYLKKHPEDRSALRESVFLETRSKESDYVESLERKEKEAADANDTEQEG